MATVPLDIAHNGFSYEDFSEMSKSQQIEILLAGKNQMKELFSIEPTVFFPPYYYFNENTIAALNETNFNVISSQVFFDPPPYKNK